MAEKILNLAPEFFDIFGIGAFVLVLIIGIWMLISKKKLPQWTALILIIIGLFGLIIDFIIVFINYLK